MEAASPAEVAARVVAALIDTAERRARTIPPLSEAVRAAVIELDPLAERDQAPTYLRDLEPWVRLDSFDRLRRAHDQLLVLEQQAGVVVLDLRGLLRLRPVGSIERPVGYTPARAHAVLMVMAQRRAEMLSDMAKAEKVLRARLSPATSSALRSILRQVTAEELRAQQDRVRLTELLTPPSDGRQAG